MNEELTVEQLMNGATGSRKYYREHKNKWRAYHWKYNFGLSLEQVAEMFRSQGGKCAVCEKPFEDMFDIDHCHQLNKVRGLLCRGCNHLMAALDKPGWLEKAMEYWVKYPQ